MYGNVLHIHTAMENKQHWPSYVWLYLDVLHVHTAIVRMYCIFIICLASFIWMYCMFIQLQG